nr:DNA repair protein RadC [uncultured Mediterraneibacter sp.]
MENKNHTIKEMYRDERPYEKCEQYGAEHLTDVELLAVLLRTGTKGENSIQLAQKILHPEFGQEGILNIHHWSMQQLLQVKGIGKVKAIQILCLAELTKRLAKAEAARGLDFSSPDTIAQYYMEDMRHKKKEVMKLLLLNTKSRLIAENDVSTGTVNMALVSPRELFVEALQKNAVSIILLHNHPSGDPTPSREDLQITQRVRQAGDLIGVELLDHIIIGDNRYISLREIGFFG